MARARIVGLLAGVVVGVMFTAACGGEPPTPTPGPAAAATTVPTATSSPVPPTNTPLPTATPAAALRPCGAESQVSRIETPVPVTPTPTRPPASPSPAASPTAPPPTATPRPAPQVDRVGFPEGYKDSFKQFYVFDRFDSRVVSYVCANDVAMSAKAGEPLPYGSILVFEAWRARQDAAGKVIEDASGHLIRETLTGIFVMRKEQGFGEAYQNLRTGEWEYVAFRPDKTYSTPPQGTHTCASCHQAASSQRDWVFRAQVATAQDRYARTDPVPAGALGISRMAFHPNAMTVTVGATLQWVNSTMDGIPHTVTAADKSFDSGILQPGASFSHTFSTPGTFQYVCSLHPEQMRARIEVKN